MNSSHSGSSQAVHACSACGAPAGKPCRDWCPDTHCKVCGTELDAVHDLDYLCSLCAEDER